MRKLSSLLVCVCVCCVAMAENRPIESPQISGLVSHWSFDNDTKKSVVDSQSHFDGVPTKIKYQDGVIGKAASFDGENSKIIILDRNNMPPARITSMTMGSVSFWIKFENRGGQMLPILYLGKDNLSMPSRGMLFEIGHDRGNIENRRLYFTAIYSMKENFCVDSGMNLQPGVWYHYVAVMGASGSTIYLNGVEITTRRYNLNATKQSVAFFDKVTNKEQLSIGYGRYSQEEPFFSFNGLIDDMRIYDRPLTTDEVVALFEMAGLRMGDPQLGYIDARSMEGREPIERGQGQNGSANNRTQSGNRSGNKSGNRVRTTTNSGNYRN